MQGRAALLSLTCSGTLVSLLHAPVRTRGRCPAFSLAWCRRPGGLLARPASLGPPPS